MSSEEIEQTIAAPVSVRDPTAVVVVGGAIMAGLYLGREVLIPLALAAMLAFVLGPLVTRLRRLGLSRPPAVILVVILALGGIGGLATVLTNQAADLASNLPSYESNLRSKMTVLGSAGGMFDRMTGFMQRMSHDLDTVQVKATAAKTEGERPLAVELHDAPTSPLGAVTEFAGALLSPLATLGLVLLYLVFLLMQREDLRDRAIRLFGARDVHRATQAMNDAAKRISRFLRMQLVVNLTFGSLFGLGLWVLGVPNALLWGLLGAVLRFVPYVGSVIALLFPLMLALAAVPGWTLPLLTVALYVAIELVCAYGLEPILFASSTGLSPIAVIVSTVFWTILWGPLGLLLATPLTACAVVLGRHVPQLEFLGVMLGNEAPLTPAVKLYQRLLADDPDEAAEIAEQVLEADGFAALGEEVVLPALRAAEHDRRRGALDRAGKKAVASEIMSLIDVAAEEIGSSTSTQGPLVVCLGMRGSLDDTAAVFLAHLLRQEGFTACVAKDDRSLSGRLAITADDLPALVCLVTVDPYAEAVAQRLVRRLHRQWATDRPIVLGLYGRSGENAPAPLDDSVVIATTLVASVVAIRDSLSGPASLQLSTLSLAT